MLTVLFCRTRKFTTIPRFFFNDPATTEIYTLSLHDALPIYPHRLATDEVRQLRTHRLKWRGDCRRAEHLQRGEHIGRAPDSTPGTHEDRHPACPCETDPVRVALRIVGRRHHGQPEIPATLPP